MAKAYTRPYNELQWEEIEVGENYFDYDVGCKQCPFDMDDKKCGNYWCPKSDKAMNDCVELGIGKLPLNFS